MDQNYYLACCNTFLNGRRFDSMVEAITAAKGFKEKYPMESYDVMCDVDRDNVRVVWASGCDIGNQYPVTRSKTYS